MYLLSYAHSFTISNKLSILTTSISSLRVNTVITIKLKYMGLTRMQVLFRDSLRCSRDRKYLKNCMIWSDKRKLFPLVAKELPSAKRLLMWGWNMWVLRVRNQYTRKSKWGTRHHPKVPLTMLNSRRGRRDQCNCRLLVRDRSSKNWDRGMS